MLFLWRVSSEYAQFTLNWFLFYKRLHCSASYSNIYSVRPNTISILFLFINGILNVARFQNCATLVDILKVQKQAVSRISLFLERTLLAISIMFAIVSLWSLSTLYRFCSYNNCKRCYCKSCFSSTISYPLQYIQYIKYSTSTSTTDSSRS